VEEEMLDIYDEQLHPVGRAPRSAVHAKGYWHRTFHCWLVRREEDRLYVRFQQRAAGKDTYPGCYDITVAGHLSAGESVRDAAREIEEEVGIAASFDELEDLHTFRAVSEGSAGGIRFVDREFSHVYALRRDVPLDAFRLQATEVAGIYEADAGGLIDLFENRRTHVQAHGRAYGNDGTLRPCAVSVRADGFVPREGGYYAGVFRELIRRYSSP